MTGGLNELALFAGGGGGILGGKLLGWTTRCAVEYAPGPRDILLARQADGSLERFPIWDDVSTFNGHPWRGHIDVVTGGFPCQDISSATTGAAGLAGEKSGLFWQMLRVVGEVRPKFVFAENSPQLRTRGLVSVLHGFTSLGYDTRWCILGAKHLGAPHERKRLWLLAHDNLREGDELPEEGYGEDGQPRSARVLGPLSNSEGAEREPVPWWSELPFQGVDDGMADRLGRRRLAAIGNGQVPAVAAAAFDILSSGLV